MVRCIELKTGSLIADPGDEIRAVMTGTKEGIETPFPVEFARNSSKREGAPTLVPVKKAAYDDAFCITAITDAARIRGQPP